MAGLRRGNDPHAQIQRIAVNHDPPPVTRRESQFRPVQNPSNHTCRPTLYRLERSLGEVVGADLRAVIEPQKPGKVRAREWGYAAFEVVKSDLFGAKP
jgi:hypothetical protein